VRGVSLSENKEDITKLAIGISFMPKIPSEGYLSRMTRHSSEC
jgi:hypothetical protein